MARMHARKKGKSGSTKPVDKKKPAWVKITSKKVEELVIELAKKGNSSAKIGLILRDQYGVPDVKVITGKKIENILKSKELLPQIPFDLQDLIKQAISVRKHLDTNKKDKHSRRGLQLIEAKIWRLTKYYKRTEKIDKNWKYEPSKIQL